MSPSCARVRSGAMAWPEWIPPLPPVPEVRGRGEGRDEAEAGSGEEAMNAAKGCVNGLVISLAFWIVLALIVVLVVHFFPIW